MTPLSTTSPAPAGAAACLLRSSATTPRNLQRLAALLEDDCLKPDAGDHIAEAAEALRELSEPEDAAPAGTLAALALLLADLRTDAEALRELLADAEPTSLHVVLADALAVLSWRCDFGRRLAGHAGAPLSTAEELFIRPAVLRCVGGEA